MNLPYLAKLKYDQIISEQQFVDVMNLIKEQSDIDEKVSNALELVCGSHVVYGAENKYLEATYKLFECIFNETAIDMIGWYLYEVLDHNETDIEFRTITYKDFKIIVNSFSDLYYVVTELVYKFIDSIIADQDNLFTTDLENYKNNNGVIEVLKYI